MKNIFHSDSWSNWFPQMTELIHFHVLFSKYIRDNITFKSIIHLEKIGQECDQIKEDIMWKKCNWFVHIENLNSLYYSRHSLKFRSFWKDWFRIIVPIFVRIKHTTKDLHYYLIELLKASRVKVSRQELDRCQTWLVFKKVYGRASFQIYPFSQCHVFFGRCTEQLFDYDFDGSIENRNIFFRRGFWEVLKLTWQPIMTLESKSKSHVYLVVSIFVSKNMLELLLSMLFRCLDLNVRFCQPEAKRSVIRVGTCSRKLLDLLPSVCCDKYFYLIIFGVQNWC